MIKTGNHHRNVLYNLMENVDKLILFLVETNQDYTKYSQYNI